MPQVTAIYQPTPAELAQAFWEMDDAQQGLFFDELGTIAMTTPAPFTRDIGTMFPLAWQMYMASCRATPLGRDAMSRICENGKQILKPTDLTTYAHRTH